jgi:hypothetical protein
MIQTLLPLDYAWIWVGEKNIGAQRDDVIVRFSVSR